MRVVGPSGINKKAIKMYFYDPGKKVKSTFTSLSFFIYNISFFFFLSLFFQNIIIHYLKKERKKERLVYLYLGNRLSAKRLPSSSMCESEIETIVYCCSGNYEKFPVFSPILDARRRQD